MSAGSLLYNDPSGPPGAKCEEALSEFSKAYELSASWKALRAMAICEQKLERDGSALAHYEQVLQLGGAQMTPEERAQIDGDVRTLRTALAQMRITTNQPQARLVATRQLSQGLPVTNRYPVQSDGVTLGLHPGQYTFVASADGFPDVTWQAEVPNGSRLEHHFDFVIKPGDARPPGVEMERPVPITVWIFTGVTGACAITTGTFMGLAKVANDDFEEQNNSGTATQAELEDLRSDVITKNIVADVFIGATAAAFGVTLIFYFTRPEEPVAQGSARSGKTDWMLLPVAGPDSAGATFMSSF